MSALPRPSWSPGGAYSTAKLFAELTARDRTQDCCERSPRITGRDVK
jgi:hypothetical protein